MSDTMSKYIKFTMIAVIWLCSISSVISPQQALAYNFGAPTKVEYNHDNPMVIQVAMMRGQPTVVDHNIGRQGQGQPFASGQSSATSTTTTTTAPTGKSCGSTLSGSYQTRMQLGVDPERTMCADGRSSRPRYFIATIGKLCTNGALGDDVVLSKRYFDWFGRCEPLAKGGASCGTHASGTSWEVITKDTNTTVCTAPMTGFKDCTVRTVYTCNNGTTSSQSARTCSADTCIAPKSCGPHASGTTWHSLTSSPVAQACDAPLLGNKTCSVDTVNKCTDGVVSVVSADTTCSASSCRAPKACGDHQSGTTWESVSNDPSPPVCALPLLGNQTCSIKTVNQCADGKVTVVSSDKTCNSSSCTAPKACGDHQSGSTWETVTNDPSPPYCELPLIGKQTCSIKTVSQCYNGSETVVSSNKECVSTSCAKPETPLSNKDAFLLLVKTGFQPTQAELQASGAYLTRRAAVNALVDGLTKNYTIAPPTLSDTDQSTWWVKDTVPANWGGDARFGSAVNSMRSWYVSQMIASPSPLSERLILFWHNHFTTAVIAKEDVWYGFKQHQAIRANFDNYATLLSAMVKDPAMLWYLDQVSSFATPEVKNSKGVVTAAAVYPSANFARELLELFTLGEGNYTEQDVTVASYALTGQSFDWTTGKFVYYANKHYNFATNWANIPAPVTLLGQKVDTPDDVVRVLLTEPHHYAATRVVTKLWKEFVSSTPDTAKIDEIAAKFQDPQQYNYDIKPVLVDLFMTDDFWNVRGTLVKSPIEYTVGIYRELGLPVSGNLNSIVYAFSAMGQELLDPPSVQGYLGGNLWINTYSLSKRQAYASAYGSQWGTEVFGSNAKLPQISDYESFISPRITTKTMLNPPTNRYVSIVEAQQQVLSDPAYSLK